MLKRLRSTIDRVENLIRARQAYKFVIRDWVGLSDLPACADVLSTMRFTRNLKPLIMEAPARKRLLILAPHPDDEMIGPGGTVIEAVRKGCDVKTLYLSSGSANRAQASEREAEARRVADRVGFDTEFMTLTPLEFDVGSKTTSRLAQRITAFAPDILLITFLLDDHDDHRRASEMLFRAFENGEVAGDIEVWAYQVYTSLIPNVVIDITDTSERKAEAIGLFTSQNKSRDWAHFALGLNAYNSRLLAGFSTPRYVEAFFVLPLKDYADLCRVYFDRPPSKTYYSDFYRRSDV
jgi:N-acetylglucosamine malate deacetylase 1